MEEYCIQIIPDRKNTCEITHFSIRQQFTLLNLCGFPIPKQGNSRNIKFMNNLTTTKQIRENNLINQKKHLNYFCSYTIHPGKYLLSVKIICDEHFMIQL